MKIGLNSDQLKKEKDVVGIYISGHPLDDYMDSVKFFSNIKLNDLKRFKIHLLIKK